MAVDVNDVNMSCEQPPSVCRHHFRIIVQRRNSIVCKYQSCGSEKVPQLGFFYVLPTYFFSFSDFLSRFDDLFSFFRLFYLDETKISRQNGNK